MKDEATTEPLYVGRPNIGNRAAFLARVNDLLDRRRLTNDGPFVQEFERRIATLTATRRCVATCNATVALQLAVRALGLQGEVILPSYTFIATAHALQWEGISPVFADIDPATHNVDPASIAELITPLTSGIVGVHLWGQPCDTVAIQQVAEQHGLRVMYDAAHALGCSHDGKMIGGFGACEILSFHATKFINSFEGGAVVTDDDDLADRIRLTRNFGFAGFDNVEALGINAKMSEVCAAMGLTSLESIDELIATNAANYDAYRKELAGLPGISVRQYDPRDRNNYQYIVIEVDPDACPIDRDQLVEALHAEQVIARKYFWPGCHRMEPYRTTQPNASQRLPQTEIVAARVIVLPSGQSVDERAVSRVCRIIRDAVS